MSEEPQSDSDTHDYRDLFGDDETDKKNPCDEIHNEGSDYEDLFGSKLDNAESDKIKGDANDSDYDEMFASDDEDELERNNLDVYDGLHILRVPKKKRKRNSNNMSSLKNVDYHDTTAKSLDSKQFLGVHVDEKNTISAIRKPPPLRPDQYPVFTVDQYWSSLRRWNFLLELNHSVMRHFNSNNDQINVLSDRHIVIPDSFHCLEQYISIWAPLLLTETKAQILSDFTSNLTNDPSSIRKLCLPVTVTPKNQKGNRTYTETLSLHISYRDVLNVPAVKPYSDLLSEEFSVNDLILLVCDPSIVSQFINGTLQSSSSPSAYSINPLISLAAPFADQRLGVIGTVTSRNKVIDQFITVNISRHLWKENKGKCDLYLIRIRSNVTSFREYKALCNISMTPMARHLLSPTVLFSEFKKEHDDGINLLPIGFRIWAKSKFNSSQRTAISSVAHDIRGSGGFTLIKGPPGTGKTQTAVACLNALHLRQFQLFYSAIEKIALSSHKDQADSILSINEAAKVKPRILVCAPSNSAIDHIVSKVTSDRFLDGNGGKYTPSIIRIGSGHSMDVSNVTMSRKIDDLLETCSNAKRLEESITAMRTTLKNLLTEIWNVIQRIRVLACASPYNLSRDWEIRIDEENFCLIKRALFVNHKTQTVTLKCPPKPSHGEKLYPINEMPHYRANLTTLTALVEKKMSLESKLFQHVLVQNAQITKTKTLDLVLQLEFNLLESAHIVLTTLGTVGSRTFDDMATKFNVCLVDEAAQASEPQILPALVQLCGSHTVLVGDPQQLPATVFSLSGRTTKYDRSLFQRLEEAGHEVHLLNTQYRMHPDISKFPRLVFYQGQLKDAPCVRNDKYGDSLERVIRIKASHFQRFNVLDLESSERNEGTSLSNIGEAELVLYLFQFLSNVSNGDVKNRIAIISPYMQQVALIRRCFEKKYGMSYENIVQISTIDAFQGKESDIVILSSVRAATKSKGIGFLSDLKRLNVALTRSKFYLFIICKVNTVVQNPYWDMLVKHAKRSQSLMRVLPSGNSNFTFEPIMTRK